MALWKKITIVLSVTLFATLLSAQTGPTVFTPRLTVSPGDLTVTTGNLTVSTGATSVQNLTVNGTCTGCSSPSPAPAGSNTQVQFNSAGAFGGDAGLVYNAATDTLTTGILSATTVNATTVSASALTVAGSAACTANGTNCPGANPATSIGLTAVNGSASTLMRSDGAPALSQTISPVWTGFHNFSAGLLSIGEIGNGHGAFRTDAQIEAQNLNGSGHALISIANTKNPGDATEEAALALFAYDSSGGQKETFSLSALWVSANPITGYAVTRLQSTYSGGNLSDYFLRGFGGHGASMWGTDDTTPPGDKVLWVNGAQKLGPEGLAFSPTIGAPTDGVFSLTSSTQPNFYYYEADAPSDEKIWRTVASGGSLFLIALNDAQNSQTVPIQIDRTGTTIDSIALTSTAVTINGQNVCRANGTGCPAATAPGGSDTQVQYNNAGTFGGDAGLVYNAGTDTLTAGTLSATSASVSGSAVCTANGTNCPGGSVSSGSYTGTVTGCTTNPAPTIQYAKFGPMVIVTVPAFTCTSNATSFTITGAPVSIRPTTNCQIMPIARVYDNGTISVNGYGCMSAGGVISLGLGAVTGFSSWTVSGTKGTEGIQNIVYNTDA
jgi:hypothetical protein